MEGDTVKSRWCLREMTLDDDVSTHLVSPHPSIHPSIHYCEQGFWAAWPWWKDDRRDGSSAKLRRSHDVMVSICVIVQVDWQSHSDKLTQLEGDRDSFTLRSVCVRGLIGNPFTDVIFKKHFTEVCDCHYLWGGYNKLVRWGMTHRAAHHLWC